MLLSLTFPFTILTGLYKVVTDTNVPLFLFFLESMEIIDETFVFHVWNLLW